MIKSVIQSLDVSVSRVCTRERHLLILFSSFSLYFLYSFMRKFMYVLICVIKRNEYICEFKTVLL